MVTNLNICTAMLITIFAAGCSTGVKKTNFHSDYSRLHQGKYIKGFCRAPELNKEAVSRVFLEAIDTSQMGPQEKVPPTNAVFWLKNSVQDHLKTEPPCGLAAEASESTAKLTLAITYLTPGSASKRTWAGEFGAGHAIVQVEGKLTDSKTGNELAEFAERRRDSGAIGFEDIGGDAGPTLVRRLLVNVGDDFVKELAGAIKN
jgi:Domain of unknown function (DUF4410)